jgi:glycosyltransferase involved in cell wall biosynthesis
MEDSYNILFISYDGLAESLAQSQVLPYLIGLTKNNNITKIKLLTYDKPKEMANKSSISQLNRMLEDAGIKWISIRYHKRPVILSTLFDICRGIWVTFILSNQYEIGIIHARSYVPALIGVFFKKFYGKKFIFDMRGFWADERIEGGIWKKNFLYHIAKYFEKIFLLNADIIITLTESAKDEINSFVYLSKTKSEIFVIPTAVDLKTFRFTKNQAIHEDLKITLMNKFIFIYIGSLGTWYELDGLYNFFIRAKELIKNAHLLILTSQYELADLKRKEKGLDISDVTISQVSHKNIPGYLNTAHAGLAFYKPGYSRKGCCPIKVGEYLACGLPVIINEGVGDIDQIIRKEGVGAVIPSFIDSQYIEAIDKIKELLKEPFILRQRCRTVAEDYFSLDKSIEKYQQIYQKLLKK